MDKKTAAVIYAAKSTDDPRESIRSQIEAVSKAAHGRRIVGALKPWMLDTALEALLQTPRAEPHRAGAP